jgi:hypothetical protein
MKIIYTQKQITLFSIRYEIVVLSRIWGYYIFVLKHLVEISGTKVMMWFWKIYCKMVRTRQGAVTDSSPIRRREYDSLDGKEAEGDPLVDTASHLLAVSTHSERGESGGHQDDPAPRRAKLLLPEETAGHRPGNRPPSATIPNPYSDSTFLEKLVKAVVAKMATDTSSPAPRAETMVTLVEWVKGMQEMGCTTYSGEEDAEVTGHWLRWKGS